MKKTYLKPSVNELTASTAIFFCTSVTGVTSDNGMDYGGVDTYGDIIPSTRFFDDLWDDEDF